MRQKTNDCWGLVVKTERIILHAVALWTESDPQLHLKKASRATDGAYSVLHLIHQLARCDSLGYL